MSERISPSEAARLLRQRIEMGGDELFLDGMSRDEALRRVRAAGDRSGTAASVPRPSASTEGPDRGSRPRGGTTAGTGASGPPVSPPVAPAARSAPETPVVPAAPAVSSSPLVLPETYEELRAVALECTRCSLCRTRTQVVFSDGPADARLMVVGEAPGANEDETGVPFVGAAGRYLDLLLSTVGLSREESVYIANVLKCRPPGNRNPLPEEIEACSPYLRKQIELVQPSALLAVGSFSGKLLTGDQKSSLGKLRGRVHSYHGVPLVVTYHPAALLRNPNWTRPFWTDLQLLREVLDADGSV